MSRKPNKLLQFAAQQTAKSWSAFQITSPRPSLDPNLPPVYLIEVKGQRGDGMVFTIPMALDKSKCDLLTFDKALSVVRDVLQGGVQQLMTFTGCACTNKTECEKHVRDSAPPLVH